MRRTAAFLSSFVAAFVLVVASADGQVTSRVSVGSAGEEADGSSYAPALSADGRFVAFHSFATNLVRGDGNAVHDVFVHDRWTGATERVSVASDGSEANGDSARAAISADGRLVAFQSIASNLAPGDGNDAYDVFVRDRVAGTTVQVSVDSAGFGGDRYSWHPSISADGRFVAFSSIADNLVPFDGNAVEDVFVHDQVNGETRRVSITSAGAEVAHASFVPAISADGRFVAFTSSAYELSPYHYAGTFVHDAMTGATRQVREDTTGGALGGTFPSISADGRWVAIESRNPLSPIDRNEHIDVFVRDMSTFSTTMVSLRPDGTTISGYDSVRPSISGDGRLVVYGTDAGDVVAGDGNGASDVILRDLTRGANVLVSATPSGTSGNGCSGFCPDSGPVLSSDGCTVAFTSFASDLVTGDGNGVADVFVRDLVGVRPLLLSRVEPATGSSAGGDLVHVIGCGFAPDAGVQFGAAAATVIDVRANRIRLRAPAGAGAVEVSVTGSTGSAQLAGAYAYLDPALAARLGNVHEGLGDREDVLDVDGSHGNGARELMLRVRQPIVVRLAAPSTRASARYCLYVWRGTPNTGTITSLPAGVGTLVLPAPFSGGVPQPRAIFNNLGYASVLGAPTIPSTPAPAIVVSRASGSPIPIDVTLQGLIEDDGAANSRGVSLTNAMIVRVR